MINLEGLRKLGYDSISLSVSGTRGELEYIDEEIDNWRDGQDFEEKYIINIFVNIYATNLDTQKKGKIGKLTGN